MDMDYLVVVMLGNHLITQQTGAEGVLVNKIMLAESLDFGINIAQLDAETEQRSLKEYGWAISIGASISDFTPVRDNEWKDNSISIRHYFSDGFVAEFLRLIELY